MEDMKPSGIQWIGDIPSEWGIIPVKYWYNISNGSNPMTEEGPTPVYGSGSKSFKTCEEYKEGPAVLLGRKGTVNIPQWVEGHYWNVDTAFDVKPKTKEAVLKFLYYCAICFDYDYYMTKTSLPSMTQNNYYNYQIPHISNHEQQAIADYLDDHCFKIDEIIAEATASIEEYKELKQAVIFEAVTKGLDKNVPTKDSGMEWLPHVPQHWDVRRIASIYDESKETGRDDLPILLVSIHTGISDREIEDNERDRKVIRSEDKTVYKVVRKNYLAYNMMRAWQGGFGAATVDGLVSPAYVVAKPKIDVNSAYIENVLRTPNAIEHIRGLSYGVADFRLRLYWPYFKNIRVPFPSVAEQDRIVAFIQEKAVKMDALISEKQALIADLQAYKKSLIYEVVTGKRRVV